MWGYHFSAWLAYSLFAGVLRTLRVIHALRVEILVVAIIIADVSFLMIML